MISTEILQQMSFYFIHISMIFLSKMQTIANDENLMPIAYYRCGFGFHSNLAIINALILRALMGYGSFFSVHCFLTALTPLTSSFRKRIVGDCE